MVCKFVYIRWPESFGGCCIHTTTSPTTVTTTCSDLRSGRDLNFRVELTKLDLCAKFQLPSFSRDFRAHDLNFPCKWIPNATPP